MEDSGRVLQGAAWRYTAAKGEHMKRRCIDCDLEIPPGELVIRNVMFEAVAFHKDCWALRHVPEQRSPAVESVSHDPA